VLPIISAVADACPSTENATKPLLTVLHNVQKLVACKNMCFACVCVMCVCVVCICVMCYVLCAYRLLLE